MIIMCYYMYIALGHLNSTYRKHGSKTAVLTKLHCLRSHYQYQKSVS